MAMLPFAIVYHKLWNLQCFWNDERGFEQVAMRTNRIFKIQEISNHSGNKRCFQDAIIKKCFLDEPG
jgi:hypothetical protein